MTAISHKYKFVFLGNKKCASSSIRDLLKTYSDIWTNQGINSKPVGKHYTALQVKEWMSLVGHSWDEYFVFTTIRNPVDRILSSYSYERKRPKKFPYSINEDIVTYIQKKRYKHFTDIKKFAFGEDGRKLVNSIIRVEDFPESLYKIFKRIGIPLPKNVPKTNSSNSQQWKRFITPDIIEVIKKRHPDDFAYYQ